jgi:hypothetical protein
MAEMQGACSSGITSATGTCSTLHTLCILPPRVYLIQCVSSLLGRVSVYLCILAVSVYLFTSYIESIAGAARPGPVPPQGAAALHAGQGGGAVMGEGQM